jgi:hypothetical protein
MCLGLTMENARQPSSGSPQYEKCWNPITVPRLEFKLRENLTAAFRLPSHVPILLQKT